MSQVLAGILHPDDNNGGDLCFDSSSSQETEIDAGYTQWSEASCQQNKPGGINPGKG